MSADIPSAQAWFCSSRWPSGLSCCASREQGDVARCRVSLRPITWQGLWRRTRLSILILLSQLTYKIELIYIHGVLNEGCFGDPLCLTADPCLRHYRLRNLPTFRLFPSNFCRDTWILPHLHVRQVLGKALDEWLMHVLRHLRKQKLHAFGAFSEAWNSWRGGFIEIVFKICHVWWFVKLLILSLLERVGCGLSLQLQLLQFYLQGLLFLSFLYITYWLLISYKVLKKGVVRYSPYL